MQFQFDIASTYPTTSEAASSSPAPANVEMLALLRQILEVQREHLSFLRATHDANARWRASWPAGARIFRSCLNPASKRCLFWNVLTAL